MGVTLGCWTAPCRGVICAIFSLYFNLVSYLEGCPHTMVHFVKVLEQLEEMGCPFSIWILGIKLRLSGLIIGTFTGCAISQV